jgi:arylamine N-acetyltransferase
LVDISSIRPTEDHAKRVSSLRLWWSKSKPGWKKTNNPVDDKTYYNSLRKRRKKAHQHFQRLKRDVQIAEYILDYGLSSRPLRDIDKIADHFSECPRKVKEIAFAIEAPNMEWLWGTRGRYSLKTSDWKNFERGKFRGNTHQMSHFRRYAPLRVLLKEKGILKDRKRSVPEMEEDTKKFCDVVKELNDFVRKTITSLDVVRDH